MLNNLGGVLVWNIIYLVDVLHILKLCHPLEKLKGHLFSWHLSHFYNPVSASFFIFVCPTSSHRLPSLRQTAFTHCCSIKLIDSQSVDLIPTLLNGFSLETLKFKTYLKTLFLLSPFTDFPILKESLIFIILIYTNAFLTKSGCMTFLLLLF